MSQSSRSNNWAAVSIRGYLRFICENKEKQWTFKWTAQQNKLDRKYDLDQCIYFFKREAQARIKHLCYWLGASGSPAAAGVIWRRHFPKENCKQRKHGSQTWTSKRSSNRVADLPLSDPPGGGLRCGGRFGSDPGYRPLHGGFLRLPRLVRTEAERTAVIQTLLISCLSRHATIRLVMTDCGLIVTFRHNVCVGDWYEKCLIRTSASSDNGNYVSLRKVEGIVQDVRELFSFTSDVETPERLSSTPKLLLLILKMMLAAFYFPFLSNLPYLTGKTTWKSEALKMCDVGFDND